MIDEKVRKAEKDMRFAQDLARSAEEDKMEMATRIAQLERDLKAANEKLEKKPKEKEVIVEKVVEKIVERPVEKKPSIWRRIKKTIFRH